jgi:hypothetical protein
MRAYAPWMAEPMEPNSVPDAAMTHRQIIERFKKLFGRDMTPNERKALFLPSEATLAEEKK